MAELDMALTDTRVRKWGRMKVGISDYGDAGVTVPSTASALFVSGTHLPTAWPVGVKELGYITTAGITDAKSISANKTQMLQSLIPVRSDLEGIEKTISGVFGESNAWTNALYHLLPVSQWPATKDAAWAYSDGAASESPDYVLWLAAVDGVGSNAVYRVEMGLRMKIGAIESRNLNRSDPEGFGFTFDLLLDPVTGMSHLRAEDGPSFVTHITAGATPAPYIANVQPSGAAVGSDVLVTGSYLGASGAGITAFTIDGVAVAVKTWVDSSHVIATIPTGVAGASPVILTTAAGASNTFAYTAA